MSFSESIETSPGSIAKQAGTDVLGEPTSQDFLPPDVSVESSNRSGLLGTPPLPEQVTGKESLMRPMTVRELRNVLSIDIHKEEGSKYYAPLNKELFSLALHENVLPEKAKEMYERIKPHWDNLRDSDDGVTDMNNIPRDEVKMVAHSERVGGMMFDFAVIYLALSKMKREDFWNMESYHTQAKEIALHLDDIQLSPAEIRMIARFTLVGLLHDIGKGVKDEDRIDGFRYRDILMSKEERTTEQVQRIQGNKRPYTGHAVDGAIIAYLAGLPSFLIEPIINHHKTLDLHRSETSLATKMLTLCDDDDAIISNRNYQNARPIELIYHDDKFYQKHNHFRNPILVRTHMLWTAIQLSGIRGTPIDIRWPSDDNYFPLSFEEEQIPFPQRTIIRFPTGNIHEYTLSQDSA